MAHRIFLNHQIHTLNTINGMRADWFRGDADVYPRLFFAGRWLAR